MLNFLESILKIDSTSRKENELAFYIRDNFHPEGAELELQKVKNGRINLFFKWGKPRVIFCSHFDTVPPYIPPRIEGNTIHGRGSCDAKGQLACMYEVSRQLYREGATDFGFLLLAGEEDGSHGAKRANELVKDCEYVVIGEPTRNKLIEASKGTLLAKAVFKGISCHSGYQQYGDNAVNRMLTFLNRLSKINFIYDRVLGETTYNFGQVKSNNAHNVVPDNASVNIFFRTTSESHHLIRDVLNGLADEKTRITYSSNDEPMEFHTLPGFETDVVSYGTDAPSLGNLGKKLLYGPGSILTAHTDEEHVTIKELERAVKDLKRIYELLGVEELTVNG